ncbi:glycosyltransferase [Novosphingobium sp.]|uniref:glycosyltransferase n=1 Tax=Novosphingobium sp. TaxID=1874826 RepID=UPI0038B7B692|nr:glycosyltransferase [Pseudomonadota bacterium]
MKGPLSGLRIGLLTPWASRAGGGVFEVVALQAGMIRAAGGESLVFALDRGHADEDTARFAHGSLRLCRQVGPSFLGYAPDMVDVLVGADLDLLHLHGIWMYPSAAGAAWARRTGRPYIVSPHGMLDPWITGRGRWKKALARAGYERRSWQASACFHALTQREAEDIRRESGRADTIVIPNAGPLATIRSSGFPPPQVVYIGRIHPKKNLLPLVAAWKAAARPAEARLVIAGWGAEADVAALTAAIGDDLSIDYIGPIFGEAKDALIAGARYVVLPSLSEGLPMAILEAWAAGVPTIMTDECNLPEGLEANAAVPCGFDAAAIAAALDMALAMPPQDWAIMAANARQLYEERFSAAHVASAWVGTYARLAAANARFAGA